MNAVQIEYKDGRKKQVETVEEAKAVLRCEWPDLDYEIHSDRWIVYPDGEAQDSVAYITGNLP